MATIGASKLKIVIVTGNANKAKEFGHLLSDYDVTNRKCDLDEVQGFPRDIASRKAKLAASQFGEAVVIEDTSLYLKELGVSTGPYCKWFGVDDDGTETAERQCRNIHKMSIGCNDKTLVALCIIAYCEPGKEPVLFEGRFEGQCCDLASGKPKDGSKYFGWDPIMFDTVTGKSFAQMTSEEKNAVSHRGRAVANFVVGMTQSRKRTVDQISAPLPAIKNVFFVTNQNDGASLICHQPLYSSFYIEEKKFTGTDINGLPTQVVAARAKEMANNLKEIVIVEDTFVFPNWLGEAMALSLKALDVVTDTRGIVLLDNKGHIQRNSRALCKRLEAICSGVSNGWTLTEMYVIGYCVPGKEPLVFNACISGELHSLGNDNGNVDGYESIFYMSTPYNQTLASMTPTAKYSLSHRKSVYEMFINYLNK